jgi:WD40 repeat protein
VLAGGTELVGADAEIHLWDLRNPSSVVRSFVDSHRDDITDLKFHPTIDNYLMSGSTDGFVNVYDLNEQDEDDALHQVITFSSVHSCHFTQERRIAVLSHMETLAFHDLNDTKYEENNESQPNDLGDIRSVLPDCEYVVDISPRGFISYGANTQRKLTLLPFNPITEQFDTNKPAWFPDAHGEEVVRDLLVLPNSKNALTCGEDGQTRLWELPYELQTIPFASGSVQDIIIDNDEEADEEKKEKKKHKAKKEKKEKKEKKNKKEKKEKRSKHDDSE